MKKQYLTTNFVDSLNNDSKLNFENIIILICAIFIASIGLNMNSTATIIGAMLISPLMSPLLAIGTGIAIYNTRLLKNGLVTLLVEVTASLVASTVYFYFSPLSYASQEIISRTNPTIWDVMIALFGGAAGIIGATKKGATNIVPGVAIATALMPPLCTAGYGLATLNKQYFLGASYLFLINVAFIILTAIVGVKIMHWFGRSSDQHISFFHLPTYKEILFTLALLLLIIPSIISAHQMVQQSIIENNVQQLISSEFSNSLVIKDDVDVKDKTINLTISGSKANSKKIKHVREKLKEYNLADYSLNVIQVAQLNSTTEAQLNNQITNIVNRQQQLQNQKNEQRIKKQEQRNKRIATLSHNIKSVTAVSSSKNKNIIIVELAKPLDEDQEKQLTLKIKKKFPSIDKIEYVLKADQD